MIVYRNVAVPIKTYHAHMLSLLNPLYVQNDSSKQFPNHEFYI